MPFQGLPDPLSFLVAGLKPTTVAATPPFLPPTRNAARASAPVVPFPVAPAPAGPAPAPTVQAQAQPQKKGAAGLIQGIRDPRAQAFLMNAAARLLQPRQIGETGAQIAGQGLLQGYQGMQMLSYLQQEMARRQREEALKTTETLAGVEKTQAEAGRTRAQIPEIAKESAREERKVALQEELGKFDKVLGLERLGLQQRGIKTDEEALQVRREALIQDRQQHAERLLLDKEKLEEDRRQNKDQAAIARGNLQVAKDRAKHEWAKDSAEMFDRLTRPKDTVADKAFLERLRTTRQLISNAMTQDTTGDMAEIDKRASAAIKLWEQRAGLKAEAEGAAVGPTAVDSKGNRVRWDGKAWVPVTK
jgi:hypothetical protein